MPITSKDLLRFANKHATSVDEIEIRASISRAYYSAYHECKPITDKLPAATLPRGQGGLHEQAIQALLQVPGHGDKRVKGVAIGIKLQSCRSLRTMADYNLGTTLATSDAEDAIALVDEITDTLPKFSALYFGK